MTPPNFSHIIGNDHVKGYLTRMLATKAMGNSLLFAGTDGIGKSLFAHAVARCLLGSDNHPDLHVYRPEGKIGMHSIESMRKFSEAVYMAPFEGQWKIFIIHDAERMLSYSANALLKTFEEPAKDSIIILLSSSPDSLLPTVLSRCRTMRFHRLSDADVESVLINKFQIPADQARIHALLANGSVGHALHGLQQGGDVIRKTCLDRFVKGGFTTYSDLVAFAAEIGEHVDASKKKEEEEIRGLFTKGFTDLSATQKANLEKEVDGAVAMRQASHSQGLFEVILSWYRDLHLLNTSDQEHLLINRDYQQEMVAVKDREVLPLEKVIEIVSQGKLALERSTPLSYVLENMCISLKLI